MPNDPRTAPGTDASTTSRTRNSKDKAERFLKAFAAVLQYTDYKALLDSYCTSSAKCSRCVVTCPIYQVTRRSPGHPLLPHQPAAGHLQAALHRRAAGCSPASGSGHELTDDDIDEMADLFYRCTACRRCTLECPMGIDHGLITRLGRYILSMTGIVPKALQVSVREQLEGETHNTSKIPQAGPPRHPGVPRGGDGGEPGRQARVSRSTSPTGSTSSSAR